MTPIVVKKSASNLFNLEQFLKTIRGTKSRYEELKTHLKIKPIGCRRLKPYNTINRNPFACKKVAIQLSKDG